MKKTYIGASWKMNKTVKESVEYASKINEYVEKNLSGRNDLEVFFLPTFLALYPVSKKVTASNLKYGAQNCCWVKEGAFTGEISPYHLKDIGCTYVELGHPERRKIFGEDYEMINRKLAAALRNDLKVILSMGEDRKYHDEEQLFKFLEQQLLAYLNEVDPGDLRNIIIAYEPAWAIGSGSAAPVDYIRKSVDFIRKVIIKNYENKSGLEQAVLYGGSVNPGSARDIITLENVNGIFIGRTSLNYDYFIEMIEAAF